MKQIDFNDNTMQDKLIEHIRRKLYDTDEVEDHFDVPTDEQIKYFMLDL